MALSAAHTEQDVVDLANALIECKVVERGSGEAAALKSTTTHEGAITSRL